ncbi:MAG: molybdenum ABC transporter permease subunit [Gaiellaceae bacterium]|nr:MAG: molybdenum ABC transporter permease subunit [Gaiellaceae bacterium]
MVDWSDPLLLSLRVSLLATALTGIVGVGGAWVIARTSLPGRRVLEVVATLPIVLPPTVLGYYLLVALGRTSPIGRVWESVFGQPLVFTWQGAVVAASIASLPYCLRTARAAISEVDVRYEQAARTMGLPEWRIALQVTLPLARRGILAGLALAFARALGDFGATLMVAGNIPGRTRTMPIAIYDAVQAGNDARALYLSVVLSLVAVSVLAAVTLLERRPA